MEWLMEERTAAHALSTYQHQKEAHNEAKHQRTSKISICVNISGNFFHGNYDIDCLFPDVIHIDAQLWNSMAGNTVLLGIQLE